MFLVLKSLETPVASWRKEVIEKRARKRTIEEIGLFTNRVGRAKLKNRHMLATLLPQLVGTRGVQSKKGIVGILNKERGRSEEKKSSYR